MQEREELAERTRIEAASLTLADRLRPAAAHVLDLHCRGAGRLRGRLQRVGTDWLELIEPIGCAVVVPLASVLAVSGLGRWSATADGEVDRRLGLGSVLRELVRDRATVQVVLVDGSQLAGTVDRVGADFVELAEHPLDQPRRVASVRRVWTLPRAAVAAVRRPVV